jgi:hypothetical protein
MNFKIPARTLKKSGKYLARSYFLHDFESRHYAYSHFLKRHRNIIERIKHAQHQVNFLNELSVNIVRRIINDPYHPMAN